MNFLCTAERCSVDSVIFPKGKAVRCTCHDCEERTAPTCCTCRWHDRSSWVCFNGLSAHRADFTDPEDSCTVWEAQTDDQPDL